MTKCNVPESCLYRQMHNETILVEQSLLLSSSAHKRKPELSRKNKQIGYWKFGLLGVVGGWDRLY